MASATRTTLPTKFMPSAGLGCWQSTQGEVGQAIEWALDAGVRLIDTAYMYQNEEEIGTALEKCIKSGKVKREELFVVTKLPPVAMHPKDVHAYFEMSRKALKLDYVDLYLIHLPMGLQKDEDTKFVKMEDGKVFWEKDTNLIAIWRQMEKLAQSGKCRSIGVSNFHSEQLQRISKIAKVPIAANQVECNAYFQQRRLRDTMDKYNIKLMAYGPLGSPGREALNAGIVIPKLLEDALVIELANKYGKTPAQVLLRHLVQLGMVVIPKSVKQHRIKENFDIFDFTLNQDEMARMKALDQGSKGRTFDLFNFFPSDDKEDDLPERYFTYREVY